MVTIPDQGRARRFSWRALTGRLSASRTGAVSAGVDVALVEKTLAEYHAAKEIYNAAKKRVDAARALLEGTPAGLYGRWRLKWGKGQERMDQPAARARLEGLGETVPMTTTSASIKVERAA